MCILLLLLLVVTWLANLSVSKLHVIHHNETKTDIDEASEQTPLKQSIHAVEFYTNLFVHIHDTHITI